MKKQRIAFILVLILFLFVTSCTPTNDYKEEKSVDLQKNEAAAQGQESTVRYLTENTQENIISVCIPVMNNEKSDNMVADHIREYLYDICQKEFDLQIRENNIEDIENSEYSEHFIEMDHRITYSSPELISIVFEGFLNYKTSAHPMYLFSSLNIDPVNGKRVFFKDLYTLDEGTYEVFKNYAVSALSEDLSNEFAPEELFDSLCSYEAFIDGLNTEKEFFVYYTKDHIGISYPVPFALGDHKEVEIPYGSI